jgi:hypothetical protein
MSNPAPPARTINAVLEEHCRIHVESEASCLAVLADAEQRLRAVIAANNADDWTTILHLQNEVAQQVADLNRRRQAWRDEVGYCLGVPPAQVTLTAVAAILGKPAATVLLQRRTQLRQQALDVARRNALNLMLVRAHLEALERVLLDLTGAGAASRRYSRDGSSAAPAFGSLLQAKG